MGPKASLDGRKISSPPGFDPAPSSLSSVAIPTELPGPHTKKVPSQKYKTPLYQYKIQGDTKLTVQDASSSIQDTRDHQVSSTRRNFISKRYKGIDNKPTVQRAISSIQDTRGYQVNSTSS